MRITDLTGLKWKKLARPVLGPGDKSSWDSRSVITPAVCDWGGGKYSMYYTGQPIKGSSWHIGEAASGNLVDWQKKPGNPIKIKEKINLIDGPVVMKGDYYYYMFFEAGEKSPRHIIPGSLRILLAPLGRAGRRILGRSQSADHARGRYIDAFRSADGSQWQRFLNKPVFPQKDVYSPCLVREDNRMVLFYSKIGKAGVETHAAETINLIYWQDLKEGPVLSPGDKGAWDEYSATMVNIIRGEDGYLGFYEGEDSRNIYRIGIATSVDLKNWVKYNANPVLSPEDLSVCSPHALLADNKIYLFYTGYDRKLTGKIYLTYAQINP